jgi:hypothetical protein
MAMSVLLLSVVTLCFSILVFMVVIGISDWLLYTVVMVGIAAIVG